MAVGRADEFLSMIRRSQRGRLKIYLGYAAGVGKTFSMLQEGHRLQNEGIDVVVGLVETHGRPETAKLLEGLEVISRRRVEYRGITLEETDVDAILKRKPQIVLIDELAHTNVPGSRHSKRYQDVQDILAQGIHVITTMNVQHLESLYDIVERASGVKVHERLPDSVLAEADQIVNVDITTEDLNVRLKEGKVYPLDRIERVMANFFKRTNLEQLRELTLRELASQIDLRSREEPEKEMAATPDQVMVCLSSKGPNSEKLLRYGSRLAGRLNRNWYAVYVQTPTEEPVVIDAQTQRMVSETLTLAKMLGAIVFTFKGEDIVKTILQFAKEYRVGHIIIGSPEKTPLWKRVFGKSSVAERLVQEARGVTVVMLDTKKPEQAPPAPREERFIKEIPSAPSLPHPRTEYAALSRFMSPGSILIWERPVTKDDLLCALTEAAESSGGIDHSLKCLNSLQERERQGSTFLNEGVAFPHVRIPGLRTAHVALGLTHGGVSDVSTEKPIECVFLILSPLENPDIQVEILGLASRAAQDRQLMEKMGSASRPEDAFRDIQDWELSRESRALNE